MGCQAGLPLAQRKSETSLNFKTAPLFTLARGPVFGAKHILPVQLGVSDWVDTGNSTPNCLSVARKRLNGRVIYAAKH
jgi:hypothetical protein